MRIIDSLGRFDYYDCIQKTVFDKDIIYHRDYSIVKGKNTHRYDDFFVLKFCNKIYRFALFNGVYHHTFELYDKAYNEYYRKLYGYSARWLKHRYISKNFTSDCSQYITKYDANPIVLFSVNSGKVEYNVILKQYGFEKIIDPYTAFQEIYMFLAAKAKPEKVIKEMSNADKVFSKGFDRFSFRKEKSK